jgi:hypothetical protein
LNGKRLRLDDVVEMQKKAAERPTTKNIQEVMCEET